MLKQMLLFIALFFPPVISVLMYDKLLKKDIGFKTFLYSYCINNIFVNFICALLKKFLFKTADALLTVETVTPSVMFNYLLTAVPVAVAVGAAAVLFERKNIRVTLE